MVNGRATIVVARFSRERIHSPGMKEFAVSSCRLKKKKKKRIDPRIKLGINVEFPSGGNWLTLNLGAA